ncbi:hypothetical protein AYL99_11690 [Fonsecaea erecta]|uniref:Chromo domain-containing protein n=1 Tax=Fonsecaea erecta TaxID=1367422 RepID=A0A178Z500_9EURO|nr:hypothetical protein AYL99_11690 [Fonsecaea erecta]OAP54155.1 hypothetical protein AYL99_11690 [Fonsecaea erecta]
MSENLRGLGITVPSWWRPPRYGGDGDDELQIVDARSAEEPEPGPSNLSNEQSHYTTGRSETHIKVEPRRSFEDQTQEAIIRQQRSTITANPLLRDGRSSMPHASRSSPLLHPPAAREAQFPGEIKPPPPPVIVERDDTMEEEWEVEDICDARLFGRARQLRYLVRFTGYADEEWRCWEDVLPGCDEAVQEFHAKHPDKPGPPACYDFNTQRKTKTTRKDRPITGTTQPI